MKQMEIFKNPEFGAIRAVEIDGEPWLVGKDVSLALGYTNPQKAIRDHVDAEDRTVNDLFTVNGTAITLINESGLYSLVLSSKLPKAKQFRRWVTSEVLPTIRKHGAYIPSTLSVRLLFYFDILHAEEVLIMSMSISQKDAYSMVFSNYPDIVSVAQMSKMLGISEKSAYRLLQENSIEHFRVGRTYKIPKLHILNYLHIIRRS